MDFSNKYVMGFAFAICLVCAGLVSTFAVALKDRQEFNKILDQRRQVIRVAGLADKGAALPPEEVDKIFESIKGRVIDRKTGEYLEIPVADVDPIRMAKDPAMSEKTPDEFNKGAQVSRLPDQMIVFEVEVPGKECVVMPMYGKGLWSTMYGYLALKRDSSAVVGITYYQHGETPGLGGEIDNKGWQEAWKDKAVYRGDVGKVVGLGVVKKSAPRDEEFEVDGLSGATITTKGVDATVKLWLGPAGYGPYLEKLN